jgi:hypothetical protein
MNNRLLFTGLLLLGMLLPLRSLAQPEENDVSLGDLARAVRRNKPDKPKPLIDNDNFPQVIDAINKQKPWNTLKYSIDSPGNTFQVSSPDVSCSLSFNARATSLISSPFSTRSLPGSELAKLSGPAKIEGDTIEISVYNGSGWSVREITVGLTIVRSATNATIYGRAKLIPASATDVVHDEKMSDTTVLVHFKDFAAPLATTTLRQHLDAPLSSGEDWHWAIIEAKGVPPKPETPAPDAHGQ